MNRVVTGWDEAGKPAILFEGEPPTVMDFGPIVTTELWVTDATPPSRSRTDTSARTWELEPPAHGLAFRTVTFHPQADEAPEPAASSSDDPDFLGEHETSTIDFVAIVSGELTLLFEGREITLRAGDSVVQQGTPHDWVNRGSEPCVAIAVLVSTRP